MNAALSCYRVNPELLELLRGFSWKKLVRRASCRGRKTRCASLFSATPPTKQLLQPFRGLTAKAVLYEVSEQWLTIATQAQIAAVDARLAADLASGRYQPGRATFSPALAGHSRRNAGERRPGLLRRYLAVSPGSIAGKAKGR
jgi:hypothetical protein